MEDEIITLAARPIPSHQKKTVTIGKKKIVRSYLSSKGFGETAKIDAEQMEKGDLGKEVARYLKSDKVIWTKNTRIVG